jgi:hypothetical protein
MDIQLFVLFYTMGMYWEKVDAASRQLAPYEPVRLTTVRKDMNRAQNDGMYHYSLLKRPENQIRLIVLLPGSQSDPIRCKITHVDLNDNPLYKALSYTWGSPSKHELRTITINELPFLITPNLWQALHHLRSEWVPRKLWIDAICINQLDDEEKGLQIQRMREIYYKASLVIVWLGEATTESNLAADILTSWSKWAREEAITTQPEVLGTLFERPWWNRSWVLQEVAANGSNPWVRCGDKWIPWGRLQDCNRVQLSRVVGGSSLWPSCLALLTIKRGTDIRVNWDSLGALLIKSYHFESTDPRDKFTLCLA